MAARMSPARRWRTAARWPLGVGYALWRYLWRTTPLHRREVSGSPERDVPPEIDPALVDADLQPPEDGVGDLYHRRYRVLIAEAQTDAVELMRRLTAHPDCAAPTEFATFQRVDGTDAPMSVGDEYVVRMPGPWDGPVRVVDMTPNSFRLATLDGHLEAGQIEFRTAPAEPGEDGVVLTIESWARSGDRFSRLMYQSLGVSKEVQLHMWISFLERAAGVAGGRVRGGVDILTRRTSA